MRCRLDCAHFASSPNLTPRFEQMAHCYVAARRALECYDILATIFSENVSIPFIGTTTLFRNSDLVKLALVCQGWRAHALRLLWRELPSTYPLWHLLAPPGLPVRQEARRLQSIATL